MLSAVRITAECARPCEHLFRYTRQRAHVLVPAHTHVHGHAHVHVHDACPCTYAHKLCSIRQRSASGAGMSGSVHGQGPLVLLKNDFFEGSGAEPQALGASVASAYGDELSLSKPPKTLVSNRHQG